VLEALLEMPADVHRGLELLAGAHALVEAHQRGQPVEVGLEAALLAQQLERLARRLEVADQLADPRLRQHRQLVDLVVLLPVALPDLPAGGAGLVGASRHVRPEGVLQGQVGGGLAHQLVLPNGQELAGAALRILGEVQHGLEVHPGHLARGRSLGLELGPARDCQRQLAAHVLELGEEAQRVEVLRTALEHVRDLQLGPAQLAELDQHRRVPQPLLVSRRGIGRRDVGIARHDSHYRISPPAVASRPPRPRCWPRAGPATRRASR